MVVTGTLPVFNLTQDGPGEKKVRRPLGKGEARLGGLDMPTACLEGSREGGQAERAALGWAKT